MIVSWLFEPPADALQIHSAFTRCRSVFTVSVIVSSPPGKPPSANNKCGYQRWISERSLFYGWMYLCGGAPSQLQSTETFEAQMSPTLKLIREAGERRLTVGGAWMKAESLPRGFSTTARKKTHFTSKHSRSSIAATRYHHCCCSRSRRRATSASSPVRTASMWADRTWTTSRRSVEAAALQHFNTSWIFMVSRRRVLSVTLWTFPREPTQTENNSYVKL